MRAFITVDLGFGDSGKGTIVDALVPQVGAKLVIRYNGGAQAGHNVVDANTGHHHTFSQFGSGTFTPGVRTLLSAYTYVNPLTMEKEEAHLASKGVTNAWNRMHIDRRALITTPYHRAINRLREMARGNAAHGSCGMGVGETYTWACRLGELALRAGDILGTKVMESKLETLNSLAKGCLRELTPDLNWADPVVAHEASTLDISPNQIADHFKAWARKVEIMDEMQVASLINDSETVVFEGAQGALLDEAWGFHPYTTWTDTTTCNAHLILQEAEFRDEIVSIGVVRVYMTRHGAGPLPTEDAELTMAFKDRYNPTNPWQRAFRCGWFDVPAIHYAKTFVGHIDGLAITHLDAVEKHARWMFCPKYDKPVYGDLSFNRNRAAGPLGFYDKTGFIGMDGLTKRVLKAEPVLSALPGAKAEDIVDTIGLYTSLPLVATSSGPTRADKKFHACVVNR
jgi:adenylosuccinate synthase